MTLLRDAVTRISIRQIRAQFSPREFATLKKVHVQAGGVSAIVKIVRVPSAGSFGAVRRWLVCPSCAGQTSVIGVVPRDANRSRFACFQCANWQSRRNSSVQRSSL